MRRRCSLPGLKDAQPSRGIETELHYELGVSVISLKDAQPSRGIETRREATMATKTGV